MNSADPPFRCLSLLALVITFTFTILAQAKPIRQSCYSSCGSIQNISYPFRLASDRPITCGDPSYELSCLNNRTVMSLYTGLFYVEQISYDKRTIHLVDVNLSGGTCNLPYGTVSSGQMNNDIRYWGTTYRNYASFMNCSRVITDPAYRELPCLGRNVSHVYVNVQSGSYTLSSLPAGCVFISMIPAAASEVDYPSYDAIRELLKLGFDLEWSVECRDCLLLSNSSCYVTKYQRPLNYYCEDLDSIYSIAVRVFFALIGTLIDLLLIGRFVIAPTIIVVYLIHKFCKERKAVDNVEKFLQNQESLMPKRYAYNDLVAMTNHFKDKLGKGGFGAVYKGQLPGGYLIAVKMLENAKFSGEEFISEVSTIGRIHHVNVVQLVGFCSEGSKRALVYEFMPNGSLDKHIFSGKGKGQSFSWEKLLEIALGTARGIEYLHNGCDDCILHFDIKPHNILLDQNYIPKVADFGLAKLYPKENDFVSVSTTRGTVGYIAPELISRNFGSVSTKTDVYSFGMVLLEMAGERKNADVKAKSSSDAYFPAWIYDHLDTGDLGLENVTESQIGIARKLCTIGLWCIQMQGSARPSMTKVIELLEGSTYDLKMPPRPFSSSPQPFSIDEPVSDTLGTSTESISESMEDCLHGDNRGYSHQSNVATF
ncbi:hypothetical protein RJ640_007583 [Escallonia rubra]|uniref:Protein kinase domain-containing protein n=1 Tax=Escallonia rubra TaxID=112253 RepID=A0AA88UH86_9ASTE|nr:hypothetical protein RJ640_007583 [Escallonia rubra]